MPKHAKTDDAAQPEEEYPDALESLVPEVEDNPMLFTSDNEQREILEGDDAWNTDKKKGKKKKKNLNVQQKKSRRMRRILIFIIILLIALIGALAYFSYTLFIETQNAVSQQEIQPSTHDVDELKDVDTKDPSTTSSKKTEVPELSTLLGKNQDEAITLLGRGATIVSTTPLNEENNPVKSNTKISLTDEPGDSRSGTPTVYLGLDAEGLILSAGYSAATSTLGYGSLSFADAIKNEFIIENTLIEAGLSIPLGTVELPADKGLYSTYATDGTTLVTENFSFAGTADKDGVPYEWSAVLRYDYTSANASGNLADTIRQIYIYLNYAGSLDVAEVEAEPEADGEPAEVEG